MATITEDYVSFEIAKLLKEKGFDEFCERFYDYYPETGEVHICGCDEHNNGRYDDEFSMPTQQMVMKWLREIHDIDVSVVPLRSHKEYLPRVEANITCYDGVPCKKYEEACEAAIKYCLENLI